MCSDLLHSVCPWWCPGPAAAHVRRTVPCGSGPARSGSRAAAAHVWRSRSRSACTRPRRAHTAAADLQRAPTDSGACGSNGSSAHAAAIRRATSGATAGATASASCRPARTHVFSARCADGTTTALFLCTHRAASPWPARCWRRPASSQRPAGVDSGP